MKESTSSELCSWLKQILQCDLRNWTGKGLWPKLSLSLSSSSIHPNQALTCLNCMNYALL
ncbi:unnamed protein product, partial [Prunus brigantina]